MNGAAAAVAQGAPAPRFRRLPPIVLAGLAVAVAGHTGAVGHSPPGLWFGSDSTLAAALAAVSVAVPAGIALIALTLGNPSRASLLSAAALSWAVSAWPYPTIGSGVLFTAGLVAGRLYPAVVGHLLLRWVPGGAGSQDRAMIAAGYVTFGVVLGVIPAVLFDPVRELCRGCPSTVVALVPAPGLREAVTIAGSIAGSVWAIVALGVLARRYLQLGPAGRRTHAAVLAGGATFLLLAAVGSAHTALASPPPTDDVVHLLHLGLAVALTVVGAASVVEWLLGRRARDRIARVVADLAAGPEPRRLRDVLASMLDDDRLQLGYAVAEGKVVDADGEAFAASTDPGRIVTSVVREGAVVAVLDHRRDVLDDPRRVDDVITVARLGLEHERLQAAMRAQLADLRDARRRIVAAGDETRRRLERDLHDGAQQRLVALAVRARLVPRGDAVVDAAVGSVLALIQLALDDIRQIAHGLYPSTLADEGLAAAVGALRERSPVPLVIEELPSARCGRVVEAAAYQLVAEATNAAPGSVSVRIASRRDGLSVVVDGGSLPDDVFRDVSDRVAAADGLIERIRGDSGRELVRVELPCAS